ncbi:hypothetical protein GC163_20135 [bacterium]|nr:hypothetical protein [bacterium]
MRWFGRLPGLLVAPLLMATVFAQDADLEPLVKDDAVAIATLEEPVATESSETLPDALPPAPSPAASTNFETSIRIEGLEVEDGESTESAAGTDLAWVGSFLVGNDDLFNLRTIEYRHRPPDNVARASRLTTQPSGSIHWIDGVPALDLPDRLYQFAIPFQFDLTSQDEYLIDLNITPAWFTDGVNRRPEMFRLQGAANFYYRLNNRDSLTAGFVYLNRDDIPALPVFGMLIDDLEKGRRFELVFPQPRLMWRLSPRNGSSIWGVISGELGGGSWAIKRTDRTPDVLTYRDFRLMGGIEVRGHKGPRGMLEAGWVFGRQLESRTGRSDTSLDDGFLARVWLEF